MAVGQKLFGQIHRIMDKGTIFKYNMLKNSGVFFSIK